MEPGEDRYEEGSRISRVESKVDLLLEQSHARDTRTEIMLTGLTGEIKGLGNRIEERTSQAQVDLRVLRTELVAEQTERIRAADKAERDFKEALTKVETNCKLAIEKEETARVADIGNIRTRWGQVVAAITTFALGLIATWAVYVSIHS